MNLKQAIQATLAYHDIFDYPLTTEEIYKYLIKKASLKAVKDELAKLYKGNSNLYTLPRRNEIIAIRKSRLVYSKSKLNRAKFYAKLLSLIPTIKVVAISGTLAMQNSHKNDDIDFVILCQKGTLWTTRFLANTILLPFRRYPNSKQFSNKACLNIFLDESDLKISRRNLYTAHEICQLKPIYDKQRTYSKFIKSNKWIIKFLPNWQPERINREVTTNYQLQTTNYKLIETFLKKFQLWYMRSKITNERIGEHQLLFHPQNTQELILSKYQKKLKYFKITST